MDKQPVDDAKYLALVKEIADLHGAESVELTIELPVNDENSDYFTFRYPSDEGDDEASGDTAEQPAAEA